VKNGFSHVRLCDVQKREARHFFANTEIRRPNSGYTLIDLLAVMFVMNGFLVGFIVTDHFGRGMGVPAGILASLLFATIVVIFYRWNWRRRDTRMKMLREQYRMIYRVRLTPGDVGSIIKHPDAEIRIGDYGWEAAPIRKDGLIYLQGLTENWRVVWHAGFLPEQVEQIGPKPASQYDYWVPYWAESCKFPRCPFPIQKRQTPDMGLPVSSHELYLLPKVQR
jgi:hypothetical protein